MRSWLVLALVALASTGLVWWRVGLSTIRQNFDGPYYGVVAKSLYNPQIIRTNFSFPLPIEYYPAHFPFYPALMRLIDEFSGIGLLNAGLVINLLAAITTAIVLYHISRSLPVSLAWLFFWPRIWAVRSIVSPETLFMLFVLVSLYLFEKRKYFFSALVGCGAVLTKSPGILLFVSYIAWGIKDYWQEKKIPWKLLPTLLMPLALVGLFGFYWVQTGDFWAYFHSGDNIHLQALPFKVFDSYQPWVGDSWLEDVWWIYLVGAVGIWQVFKKHQIMGWFGAIFYTSILFVSHRDISRYALPLAPLVLIGFSNILAKKEVRWILAILVIPAFFYTVNFLSHNTVAISDWAPFL